MARRTSEQRKADNIRNETQRRINAGDNSSYVQSQVRQNPNQFTNKERVTESVDYNTASNNTYNKNNFAQATPAMTTGFGSFFGANSGSTGSSALVQQTIQNAIDQKMQDKQIGQSKKDVVDEVMNNFYPSLDPMSQEEYFKMAGIDLSLPQELLDEDPLYKNALLDYDIASNFSGFSGGTGNLMGIPEGRMGIDQLNLMNRGDSYYGGGGGGGGYDYGGGGGEGSAAAYAMMNQGPKQLGAGENVPGQAELLDYMINVNSNNPFTQLAMPQMAAGGIMGLMR